MLSLQRLQSPRRRGRVDLPGYGRTPVIVRGALTPRPPLPITGEAAPLVIERGGASSVSA
ncbi:MAG: hypothetical protein AVDCRST_MAG68-446 [uncultured Gemmatimonadetes bacterium]|uniref:Uncharacterized protein n=1 Tax=uncultured Gemmatimonadota bacterium TaxID=203437 RepID=A0A6J4KB51_9BACT|nr:MAG: hypothetical protein AVDCRST_MAG68-446 [uncultured Gemmatimonadota bacterium]